MSNSSPVGVRHATNVNRYLVRLGTVELAGSDDIITTTFGGVLVTLSSIKISVAGYCSREKTTPSKRNAGADVNTR